jgi:rhodanese-related sulfurtransferase
MERDLAVSTEWLRERIKAGERPFLIELRRAGDVDLTLLKVRGALQLTDDEARRHPPELADGRTIVVCSAAPGDELALELARALTERGFEAFFLSGGKKAYLSAGLPVDEIGQGREMTRSRGL